MTYPLYLLTAFGVSCLVRIVPMLLIRKPIKNRFIRSFLHYIPYITIAIMLFPDILFQTQSIWSGTIALCVGILVAWFSSNLFATAGVSCLVALLMDFLFTTLK